ncbi:flagellar filament capping protein FliD [Clostridium gasigenes]|uniref:flagellar filament capping protein FliD n=1 Tax=Clostridium gasigenes TaxID=94869 RepID=UPI0014383E7E|nr:flagellar filament capping protein FliD [Clostridium gasigenes]NKF06930.1 flagellar filament capping protein FliD [Clostridium gasigenes]QSW19807.1 flagellar filament capping protein FliD [Clostridium gasigenes]
MRVTGLASGLDVDQVVKDSMKPYRIKVDQTKQKREIVEMKQQLYRDVLKDSKEFHRKYLEFSNQDSLLQSKNWGTTTFESTDSGAVSVNGLAGGKAENYKVSVTQLASKATTTLKTEYLKAGEGFALEMAGTPIPTPISIGVITADELKDPSKLAERINKELLLGKIDVTVKYSQFSNGLVFESGSMGIGTVDKPNEFKITGLGNDKLGTPIADLEAKGKNSKATITNSRGESKDVDGSSNKVVYDGVEFSFNDVTTSEVRITGKTDAKATVDKIVLFINDYNVLMEKLNKMTSEKRNKNYMPLSEEQKKEMSESEVKLWNEKTKQGQLYRDSDLTRIANKMKEAMRSVPGASINIEKIGIKPVKDYESKNGTFTVDVDKLTKALESNSEEIMKSLIGLPPEGTPENEKASKTGVLQRLKDVIFDETVTVASSLIKRVGVEGSPSVSNNDLTKSIEKYNKKMEELEKDFARREKSLYSKYAKLEVIMNKYNSQQSMMTQQMGGN